MKSANQKGETMKIGIIVYSQSGHTAAFAREIAGQLGKAGLEYDIELVRPQGIPKPWTGKIQFRKIPDITEYDILLVGAPVWAFNISKVIVSLLYKLDSLKGKKVFPFVTHGLPVKPIAQRALRTLCNHIEACSGDAMEGEAQFYLLSTTNKEKMREAAQRIVQRIRQQITALNMG